MKSFLASTLCALLLLANCDAAILRRDLSSVQGQVTKLQLINANTDTVISELEDGMVIALDAVGMNGTTVALNVEALVNGTDVRSVRFGLNGNKYFKTESNAPFAMCGNSGVNYKSCSLNRLGLGQHTITATPRNRNGQTGRAVTITIEVVEADVTPPKLISLKALSPATVDVSNGDAFVTIELKFQDDASGIDGGILQYGNSSNSDENYIFNFGNALVEPFMPPMPSIATRNNDVVTYVIRMRVRKFEKPGVYPLALFFGDGVFNFIPINAAELAVSGFPSAITIVNNGLVDSTPIEVLNLTALTPAVMNIADLDSFVTFELVIQDDLSGFDFGFLRDARPGKFPVMTCFFGKAGPESTIDDAVNHNATELGGAGSRVAIRLNLTWDMLDEPEPSVYNLLIGLVDGVHNYRQWNTTQLAALGATTTTVTVVNVTI